MNEEAQGYEHLHLETGRVCRLVLDRPPLNVLNLESMAELDRALHEVIRAQPAVVVLAAAGKAFSAGVDVADHTEDRVGAMLDIFHSIFRTLESLEAPLVALVQGAALGGGCELVAACDLVVAAESAKFGQPEIQLGVFPPVAAVELQRLLGPRQAAHWLLSGEVFSAREAMAAGLVNAVFADGSFATEAAAYLELLTRHSRPALACTKAALRLGRGPLHEVLPEIEVLYLDRLMQTADAREGIAAFMEKRPPRFQDC